MQSERAVTWAIGREWSLLGGARRALGCRHRRQRAAATVVPSRIFRPSRPIRNPSVSSAPRYSSQECQRPTDCAQLTPRPLQTASPEPGRPPTRSPGRPRCVDGAAARAAAAGHRAGDHVAMSVPCGLRCSAPGPIGGATAVKARELAAKSKQPYSRRSRRRLRSAAAACGRLCTPCSPLCGLAAALIRRALHSCRRPSAPPPSPPPPPPASRGAVAAARARPCCGAPAPSSE